LSKEIEEEKASFEAFFYATIHDLRAPLRAISNLAQWIEEDLKSAEKAEAPEHLKTLRARAAGMAVLLDELVTKAQSRG
jgi:light-regulated signal transduction histidine kinase (bacteriophytochrome)